MAEVVSAWTERNKTFFVSKDGDGVRVRSIPARYAFFINGLSADDRRNLGRDPRVRSVKLDGDMTRVDCRTYYDRRDLLELLDQIIVARDAGDLIKIYEADVGSITRIMSDVASLDVDPNPRVAYLDIETDSRKSFDEAKEGYARLLSWAICGDDQEVVSAVLESDDATAERQLFAQMFDALKSFDVVLAWNGDGFDFPVIQNRIEKLGLKVEHRRWCWLDHMQVFKKYNMHSDGGGEEKTSFALGHVATYLLGEGKDKFDASKTWQAWEAGGDQRARLLRYNEKDTTLLPRIEEKTGFLSLHIAVCNVCRIFPDTNSLNATRQGDGFLLRLGEEHGYRWPTRKQIGDEEIEKFKGAWVMTPTRTGAIDNVHVCDFAGLYPSIIRTFNMSPDTKQPNADCLSDNVCKLPNRDTYFSTEKDGMFRIALDQLVAKRAEYTNAMKAETPGSEEHAHYKRLSGAFKIVANSFYGIMGSPFSRFFDPEIAEGVTQTGRWLLENVVDESKKSGLDPFYGDTDSVFVSGDSEAFRDVVNRLNADWGNRLAPLGVTGKHHIDLDFEKTFRRVIFLAKKRYAGKFSMYKGNAVGIDAKPEVKGLEFKRGDTIRIARSFQMEVINALLEEDLPTALAVREVVERWKKYVLEGEINPEEIIISQSLSKKPDDYKVETAHVRVAKMLIARGEHVTVGQRIAYLITGMLDNKITAVPADDPDAMEKLDRGYYWIKKVFPPVKRVLDAVYPADEWDDGLRVKRIAGAAERKRRAAAEEDGQGPMRFDRECITGSTTGGARKPRRRGSAGLKIVIEAQSAETIDPEDAAGKRRFEALRAIIEANPGQTPVSLVINFPQGDQKATATIPTGLLIDPTAKAKEMIARVFGSGSL